MTTSTKEPLLLIPAEIQDAMVAHCIKASGRACCGILAGMPPRVSAIYRLRNIADNPERYDADPRDLISAFIDRHERGLTIAAIYHSCPGRAPIPNRTDMLENHYGDTPRVIVSVGKFITVRVWRLTDQSYEELDWRLLPREERSGSVDAECHVVWPEAEQNDRFGQPRTWLGSILCRAFRWLRPSTNTPIARSGDSPRVEAEPMWDPSLDSLEERGSHDG